MQKREKTAPTLSIKTIITYPIGYLCTKNYQIWWKFNEVLTKTSWVIFGPPGTFKSLSSLYNLSWLFVDLLTLSRCCFLETNQ